MPSAAQWGILLWSFLVWNAKRISSQSTEVNSCIQSYQWSLNTRKQTPCLVAAYLETVCKGIPFSVKALPNGNHYLGPTFAEADPCTCSSVYYSLISACGGCQDRTFANWTSWSVNCVAVFLTVFPKDIPPATEIPQWAYLNVTEDNNNFNPLRAQQVSEQAPGPPVPSTSTTSVAVLPTPSNTSGSPADSSSAITSHKKSNAGAIAGGVVGGIAFLAALVLALFWWSRTKRNPTTSRANSIVNNWRRKQRQRKDAADIDLDEDVRVTPFPFNSSEHADDIRRDTSSPLSGITMTGSVMQTLQDTRTVITPPLMQGISSTSPDSYGHMRNPSDPVSPMTSTFYTTLGPVGSMDSMSQLTRAHGGGGYSGAAEI